MIRGQMKAGRIRKLFVVAMALILLCSCSNSSLAGGTSETTNGVYSASVTRADGRPAAMGKVLVIDDEDWIAKIAEGRSVVLDSAVTDTNGDFKVNLLACVRCNLQIDADGEGLFIRDVRDVRDIKSNSGVPGKAQLQAAPLVSLSGTVHSDSGVIRELRLAGTAYTALLNPDGTYLFSGVAAGAFAIIAVTDQNGAKSAMPVRNVDLQTGKNQTGYDIGVAAKRIQVNDFEQDFWNQTQLGQIAGGGWFARKTGAATMVSNTIPDSAQNRSGKVFRTDIEFLKGDPSTQAKVGFELDASIDLSKLSALSLNASGTGRIYVRFHSRALNMVSGDSVQFQFPIDLQPEWAHVVIPADSLRLTGNAPAELRSYSWQNAAKDILSVDFVALPVFSDTASVAAQRIQLDDIYFEGVSLKDLK